MKNKKDFRRVSPYSISTYSTCGQGGGREKSGEIAEIAKIGETVGGVFFSPARPAGNVISSYSIRVYSQASAAGLPIGRCRPTARAPVDRWTDGPMDRWPVDLDRWTDGPAGPIDRWTDGRWTAGLLDRWPVDCWTDGPRAPRKNPRGWPRMDDRQGIGGMSRPGTIGPHRANRLENCSYSDYCEGGCRLLRLFRYCGSRFVQWTR